MWTGVYWTKAYWAGNYWNPVGVIVQVVRARMVGLMANMNQLGARVDKTR